LSIPVSVILPAYNAGPYIAEAIASILSQTYTNFELIIINDCSIDNTEEQILSFTDKRIVYTKNEENRGLIFNLNKGIELSKGKYLVRMDADDISLPDRIATQVEFMENHSEIGVSGTWFQSFGAINSISRYEENDDAIKLQMLFHCRFCHPSVIIRKQVLTDNNFQFSTEYHHAEDYELWARIGFKTQFANIQKVLLKYRVHANSVTFKYAEIQRSNSDKVIQYLFGKIGVDISAEIIPLWIKFCYVEFNLSINELKQIEKLIVALINANKASKYVSNKALEQFLVIKWFDICYNNIKNKQVQTIFNNSSVSALLPLKSRLKFRLKGLI
jgi:glycosyltransferase involved in cell wall biosynthesis